MKSLGHASLPSPYCTLRPFVATVYFCVVPPADLSTAYGRHYRCRPPTLCDGTFEQASSQCPALAEAMGRSEQAERYAEATKNTMWEFYSPTIGAASNYPAGKTSNSVTFVVTARH